jgi:hypothetical protein
MTSNVTPRYWHWTSRVRPPDARSCAAHAKLMCAPQPRDLMVRYSGFSIRHTEFGIRNSEIQNRESGYREISWCGIFHLDHLIMVR